MSEINQLPASIETTRATLMLAPRNLEELQHVAELLCRSRLVPREFQGDAASTMLVMMKAIECGEGITAAFDNWYVSNGRLGTFSDAKVARCLRRRDVCLYFRTIEETAEKCTRETHRAGSPSPEQHTYTMNDAKQASLWHLRPDGTPPIVDRWKWNPETRRRERAGQGPCECQWCKRPKLMLRHRCDSELASKVYPDLVRGQYDVDEVREITKAEPPLDVVAKEVVDIETGEVQQIVPPAPSQDKQTPIVPIPIEAPGASSTNGKPDVSRMTRTEMQRYLVVAKGKYMALARKAKEIGLDSDPIPKDASIETLREMYQALHECIEARKAERTEAEEALRRAKEEASTFPDSDMADLPF